MKIFRFVLLICCVLFFLSGNVFAQKNGGIKFTVLGGLDVFGNVTFVNDDVDLDEDENSNIGVLFGAEAAMPVYENFYVGLGVRYQLPRELDTDNSDAFGFIPIYALFQYNFPLEGGLVPYVVGHIGYNFLVSETDNMEEYLSFLAGMDISVDPEGGLYWGIGGGLFVTKNVSIQALYNTNYGKLVAKGGGDEVEIDVTYAKLTISAAYTF